MFVYSGKDGTKLHSFDGGSRGSYLGLSLSGALDVNRDGHADVILGASGAAYVHSGKDGSRLHAFLGSSADNFGNAVDGAGDVDGDGHADLLVAASHEPFTPSRNWHLPGIPGPGRVRLYSGKTARVLRMFSGSATYEGFGTSVSGAGDVNDDGFPDLVVGARQPLSWSGYATVLSAVPLALASATRSISVTLGGAQELTLDAGSAHADRLYLILGSASGRKPGIPVAPRIRIPLNYDPYLQFSLDSPNVLIAGSLGLLDARGRGRARLSLPSGLSSSLVGLRLDHAFLVATRSPFGVRFASNAVPLTLTK